MRVLTIWQTVVSLLLFRFTFTFIPGFPCFCTVVIRWSTKITSPKFQLGAKAARERKNSAVYQIPSQPISAWFMTRCIFWLGSQKNMFQTSVKILGYKWPRDLSAAVQVNLSLSSEPTTEVLPKTTTDLLDGRAVFRPGIIWHQCSDNQFNTESMDESNLPTFDGINLNLTVRLTYRPRISKKECNSFYVLTLGILHTQSLVVSSLWVWKLWVRLSSPYVQAPCLYIYIYIGHAYIFTNRIFLCASYQCIY